jgi:hypothetical protein
MIDPRLPTLECALQRGPAARAIAASKKFLGAEVRVEAAELVRHKPGKRALIVYELLVTRKGGTPERIEAVGKMRASRPPRTAYLLARELWRRGFASDSADGISVPEPLGTVPSLGIWLQRRVAGTLATDALTTGRAVPLAGRIAEAAFKLHAAGVAPERAHGAAGELAILQRVLSEVRDRQPALRARIGRLLDGSARLCARVTGRTCGIHRDFYADQVVVSGDRLYLLDFDLYCAGPAALDLGNFAGHLLEQLAREPQHAPALLAARDALEARYAELAGDAELANVRAFTALTLARHVYLSTVLPGRAHTTPRVLELAIAHTEALFDAAA